MSTTKNKILVAVSGGPDSIYLLDNLRKENKYDLVASHINYNFRKDSIVDENIVKQYCEKYNIPLKIKNVDDSILKEYSYLKNKQTIAREIRYDFFLKIAKLENIKYLFVAHHKNDFIETALMQYKRSKDYYFYGLNDETIYKDLIIKRPLLNIYKNEILDYLKNNEILYATDETNFKPIYERNKIRIDLSKNTLSDNEKIYDDFIKINNERKNDNLISKNNYSNFIKDNNQINFILSLELNFQKDLIFKFLINSKYRININSNKINSILEFISKDFKNKKYRLMSNIYLEIKNNKLYIINI